MGITIKIAGVDRTEYIDARSFSIIDELTSKVNSASFVFICNDIALAPIAGETVLIEEGSTKLFSGRILNKVESFLSPNLLKYQVKCIDNARDLDKKLVAGSYTDEKAGNIIKDIIDNYTTGFTYTNVADGPTIADIAFDYIQVSEALTKIAEICGYEWYIDYDKDIHFFAENAYPASFQLDDDQLHYKDLVIDADVSQLRNRIFVKSSGYANIKKCFSDVFIGDGVTTSWTCKFKAKDYTHNKLSNLPNLPTEIVYDVAFSHDSKYLAIACRDYPYIIIYVRSGDTFIRLNDPDILPTSMAWGVAFSHDSTYLAVAHNASPFVTIYKRNGNTFTKLANPATLPPNDGSGVDFSPNSTYLAVAHYQTPYITIYKRSGDTFTKLTDENIDTGNAATDRAGQRSTTLTYINKNNPANLSGKITSVEIWAKTEISNCEVATFYRPDPDNFPNKLSTRDIHAIGTVAAGSKQTFSSLDITVEAGDYIGIYGTAGNIETDYAGGSGSWWSDGDRIPCTDITFSSNDEDRISIYAIGIQPNPNGLPASHAEGVDFSHDSIYLAVAHEGSPYITIYKRSDDVFTKLTNPANLPTGKGYEVAFSHDSIYLAVANSGSSPYITIYKRSGDTFTKLSDPASLPAGRCYGIDFSYDSANLAVASYDSPFLIIYERNGDVFTKLDNPIILPGGTAWSVAFSHDSIRLAIGYSYSTFINVYKRLISSATLNGIAKTVGRDGIDDPVSFNYMLNGTTKLLSLGTGEPTPADGDELIVTYSTVGKSIMLRRDDEDSISVIAGIEGGDGIFEFCLTDNKVDSAGWANEVAKADLLQNANPVIQGSFITNRNDVRSGQIITLNSTKRNINQNFLIQKVELVRVDTGETIHYVYQVTIATKIGRLEDLFLYLLNRTSESVK